MNWNLQKICQFFLPEFFSDSRIANSLRVFLLLNLALCSSGCQSLGGREAVPQSVALCRTLSSQGVTAMQQGEWNRAEDILGRAVSACPSNAEARRQYAETLWHRKEFRQATIQLEEALKLEPYNAPMTVRIGEMYLSMQDVKRASRKANEALLLDRNLADAWALRARVMLSDSKPHDALADFQRALSFSPDDPTLLLEIAQLYRRLGKSQQALSTLQHLADVYPPGEEPQQVLYLIGLAYSSLGRYDDAVESLYAASVRGRPSAQLLCSLGEAEHLAGRLEAASANARQALALDPSHGPSLALARRLNISAQGSPQRR